MTSQERGDELLALYRARKHLPPEHRLDEAPTTGAELMARFDEVLERLRPIGRD